MSYINRALVSAALALGLAACVGDDDGVSEHDVKSNYSAMAYAAYSDSLDSALVLKSAVDTFIASPSEANLDTAKAAYKEARKPYQQSEIMRWDTPITLGKALDSDGGPASVDDWEGQVNAWPLDENHIVALIEGDEEINIDLLLAQNGANDNEANVTTGVHAVEFMLWGEDTHGTEAGSGERPASDYDVANCADDFCERRALYLDAAMDLLVQDLTEMKAEWSPEAEATAGTLANNFLNSDDALDYIMGAIRNMASDELASARMSAGLELGDPEEEHDCFSDFSHIAIFYNFQAVRNAWYGHYYKTDGGSVRGAGLADIVFERDIATYVYIEDALNSIESKMKAIKDAGERTENTVRYDQIIGQDANGTERKIAENAVDELVAIDELFAMATDILSLDVEGPDGSGD
ncbi:imelysin family protein [Agaribacterium sp. ZY112]|uniref:imelysin family protein n=1 Tax=Agaribacterium sp. ZY112 TaxID=3233574 RepID=UPI0035258822